MENNFKAHRPLKISGIVAVRQTFLLALLALYRFMQVRGPYLFTFTAQITWGHSQVKS